MLATKGDERPYFLYRTRAPTRSRRTRLGQRSGMTPEVPDGAAGRCHGDRHPYNMFSLVTGEAVHTE
jgi:hypothetical protein